MSLRITRLFLFTFLLGLGEVTTPSTSAALSSSGDVVVDEADDAATSAHA
jgi:hypothetical protein